MGKNELEFVFLNETGDKLPALLCADYLSPINYYQLDSYDFRLSGLLQFPDKRGGILPRHVLELDPIGFKCPLLQFLNRDAPPTGQVIDGPLLCLGHFRMDGVV